MNDLKAVRKLQDASGAINGVIMILGTYGDAFFTTGNEEMSGKIQKLRIDLDKVSKVIDSVRSEMEDFFDH